MDDFDTTTNRKELRGTGIGGGWQVILYNDDHNPLEFVVESLMRIFNHDQSMALKIAYEAHGRGKAIAEVENKAAATQHVNILRKIGLGSDVEEISL